jgi:hypothetical protein
MTYELGWVVAHSHEEVDKFSVNIVIDLDWAGWFVQENGAGTAEYLNVDMGILGEKRYELPH